VKTGYKIETSQTWDVLASSQEQAEALVREELVSCEKRIKNGPHGRVRSKIKSILWLGPKRSGKLFDWGKV